MKGVVGCADREGDVGGAVGGGEKNRNNVLKKPI